MSRLVLAKPLYGTDWKVFQSESGTYAQTDINQLLMQESRDALLEMRTLLREMNSSINTIRHFFHQPGMARAVLAVIAETNRKETRRQVRLRAQRRRRRLAKKAAGGPL